MEQKFSFPSFTATVALLLIFFSEMGISSVMSDPAKDREDCMDQLTGLATCLSYVSGQAKSPTPDCCSGLKQVLKIKKKCLCVIIRDRNDPNLGLEINVTLALTLPSVCNAPANVSKCPELLNMDPHSSEAQVFYQLEGKNSTKTANGPAPSPTGTMHALCFQNSTDMETVFKLSSRSKFTVTLQSLSSLVVISDEFYFITYFVSRKYVLHFKRESKRGFVGKMDDIWIDTKI
ncbi:hypothetical protein G4B88_015420 [Cannabis sativa]|uniref:Bifunctional inhibitor/plant lipid transfer protein/seed storage helical domain-containing protein n=1 Tax=Cannabis sativa TaxID=3483 RepID=A0A7J6ERF1_CANSA|nr:hypothetical protein G4B88_015420 [Cannabis sativa]